MPERARCRFTVDKVEPAYEGAGPGERTVHLRTQYDEPLTKEQEAFSTSTPWGSMEMGISNPALEGFFEPGKDYYIDITPSGPREGPGGVRAENRAPAADRPTRYVWEPRGGRFDPPARPKHSRRALLELAEGMSDFFRLLTHEETSQASEMLRDAAELRGRAWILAVLALQDERASRDPDFREAISAVLAMTDAHDVLNSTAKPPEAPGAPQHDGPSTQPSAPAEGASGERGNALRNLERLAYDAAGNPPHEGQGGHL